MAHIECRKLSKSFAGKASSRAFRMEGLDLDIPDGKVLSVLGPSGCGKSTLLRLIAGLEAPDSGEVIFDGIVMSETPPAERRIGMVFQDYALYPNFTSRQNVLSWFIFRKRTPELDAEAREKYARTAELLGVDIEYLMERRPTTLSSGEKQRVAVGRCITRDPRLLLLDEPFSNLDAKLRAKYRGQLRTLLTRFGVTTLFVTHDQREALLIGDLVAVMREGGIEQVGTAEQIYYEPRSVFAAEFLNLDGDEPSMSFLPGEAVAPGLSGLLLGARPEGISVLPAADGVPAPRPADDRPSIEAVVVEARPLPLGKGALIFLRAADRDVCVKTRAEDGRPPAPGSGAVLAFESCHLFDQKTGLRVRSLGRYRPSKE
jgi:multiple sugar transport system ATP-binding protein